MKNRKKVWIALVCACTLAVSQPAMLGLSSAAATSAQSAAQGELGELNNQLEELNKKQQELSEQISGIQDETQRAQAKKDKLGEQIQNTTQQIQVTQEKVSLLNEEIEQAKQRAVELDEKIAEDQALFQERIRAIQVQGQFTTLDYIFSAENFGDFVQRTQMTDRIAKYDNQILQNLKQDLREAQENKEKLETSQKELEDTQRSLETLKQSLTEQSAQVDESLSDYAEMEKAFLADKEKMQQQAKAMQDEMDAIFSQIDWGNKPPLQSRSQNLSRNRNRHLPRNPPHRKRPPVSLPPGPRPLRRARPAHPHLLPVPVPLQAGRPAAGRIRCRLTSIYPPAMAGGLTEQTPYRCGFCRFRYVWKGYCCRQIRHGACGGLQRQRLWKLLHH
ncbi:MAG: coiled-coil domain-containing protein [Oscillospiraceae bacterium]